MTDTFDYDAYREELRKSHADGYEAAVAQPGSIKNHIDMQQLFTDPQVEFGVALARLQRMEGSDQHKAQTIGTALGSMLGDVTMAFLRNGRLDLLAELDASITFARNAIVEHQITGKSPAGTMVSEARPATAFEKSNG